MAEVEKFFSSLKRKGSEYVNRDEFRTVMAEFDISAEQADSIFDALDPDRDGQMNVKRLYDTFVSHASENMPIVNGELSDAMDATCDWDDRRRSETKLALSQVVDAIGEPAVRNFLNNSTTRKLEEFFDQLQSQDKSADLVTGFKDVMGAMSRDMVRIVEENTNMQQLLDKQKATFSQHMAELVEELDNEMVDVELKTKHEEKLKYERDKKETMEKWDAEMNELKSQLKTFQRSQMILNQKKEEKNKTKYEMVLQNEDIGSALNKTQTSFEKLRKEIDKMKATYEAGCNELNSRQEFIMQCMSQTETVQQQLALLHEANKKLQDTNYTLLSLIEKTGGRITPFCGSRAGSETNSNNSEAGHFVAHVNHNSHEHANHNGANFVIQRLMEDIDNGNPTNRDTTEYENDYRSLQEELCNSSDADSGLKSIESDDGKRAHNFRRRFHVKTDSFLSTDSTSFETNGDPDRTYKLVLAGDAAVGKSCFIHRFCKGKFEKRLGSTLGVDFQIKTIRVDEKNVALQLWDTAGQERFRSMTKTYFRRADGVVLLFDVTSERSFLSIRQWIQSINESTDKTIPILLCGSKTDLRNGAKSMGVRCVDTEVAETMARDYDAIFFETSSKTGENIIDALIAITREMLLREDVEVQTSALRVSKPGKQACC